MLGVAALLWGGSGSGAVAQADPAAIGLPDARIELVSRQVTGGPSNSESGGDTEVSNDGRWVLFGSDGAGLDPLVPTNPGIILPYLVDRRTGTITMIATGADGAAPPLRIRPGEFAPDVTAHLSGDGRWAVLSNVPTGLLPSWVADEARPDIAALQFILLKDLRTGQNTVLRAPRRSVGATSKRPLIGGVSISDNGRWVAVQSAMSDEDGNTRRWVDLYDRLRDAWRPVAGPTDPTQVLTLGVESMSGDGRWMITGELPIDGARPATTRYRLVDLRTGTERLLPDNSSPVMSRDGTRLFTTQGPGFPGKKLTLTVWDTRTLRVLATRDILDGKRPMASDGAGRRLLVNVPEYNGDPHLTSPGQLYLWDWAADVLTRVTRGMDGGRARLGAATASPERVISDDGTVVVFLSKARNLVPGDRYDPFVSWDTFAAVFAGPS